MKQLVNYFFYFLRWLWDTMLSREFRAGIAMVPTIVTFPILILYAIWPMEYAFTLAWVIPGGYLLCADRYLMRFEYIWETYPWMVVESVAWTVYGLMAGYLATDVGYWLNEYMLIPMRVIAVLASLTFVWIASQPFVIVIVSFEEELHETI